MAIDTAGMGSRVRGLRQQLGLSLQDVADRAGCTKTTVWDLEKGHSVNPTINMIANLAGALGTSIDYLAGITTDKPRAPAHLSAAISAVMAVADAAYKRGKAES